MRERLLSYAQDYEDITLYHALKGVKNGFYIDVGASDPWNLSVTKFFYERGWCGINVEPLSEPFEALKQERLRDLNLNIGLGERSEFMRFIGKGTQTTCVNAEKCDTSFVCQVKTLTEIFQEDRTIHFCKIDVEGFEESVLKGCDFKKVRPLVFVIEAKQYNGKITAEWEHILLDDGYSMVLDSKLNRFYLTNDLTELKTRFLTPEALNQIYDIYHVVKKSEWQGAIYNSITWKLGDAILSPVKPIYAYLTRLRN